MKRLRTSFRASGTATGSARHATGPATWLAALLPIAAIVSGCAGSGPRERFYALHDGGVVEASASVAGGTKADAPLPGIVVSAVTVPELVDRPQIVTRDSRNQVVVSEQNLWAEPVRSGVGRTLAARLARALDEAGRPAQVGAYPQTSVVDPYLRVTIDVARFDAVPNGEAVVEALWSIRRTADGVVRTGRSVAAAPIAGTDYDAIVSAWNDALATVDRDIAAAVLQFQPPLPGAKPATR